MSLKCRVRGYDDDARMLSKYMPPTPAAYIVEVQKLVQSIDYLVLITDLPSPLHSIAINL